MQDKFNITNHLLISLRLCINNNNYHKEHRNKYNCNKISSLLSIIFNTILKFNKNNLITNNKNKNK